MLNCQTWTCVRLVKLRLLRQDQQVRFSKYSKRLTYRGEYFADMSPARGIYKLLWAACLAVLREWIRGLPIRWSA